MPITKRLVMHSGAVGIKNAIDYAKDEKHNGKKHDKDPQLVTGLHCTSDFAFQEFMMNNRKWHTEDDDRGAYHVIQSFSLEDNINKYQVHQMGVELAKELYGDFQCVVVTHTDTGCLHNHIIINATSINGRKLEDRLSNQKEGLYGLREVSDRIALEHGCHVISNPPKIGRYKGKKYLYNNIQKSKRENIKELIEYLKEECNSFDELLEHMSLEGYEINRRGKSLRLKLITTQTTNNRYIRFNSLGDGYKEQDLRNFFFEKSRNSCSYTFEEYLNLSGAFAQKYIDEAEYSKEAIQKTRYCLVEGKAYPKYYFARYLEMKKYHQLCYEIELLNKEGIKNYDDLIQSIENQEKVVEREELQYKQSLSQLNSYQRKMPLCEIYLQYFNDYQIYLENVEMYGEADVIVTDEIKLFLDAKEELGNIEIDEVRKIMANTNSLKNETNRLLAHLSYSKNKIYDLDHMKSIALDQSERYIKSMSFSKKMIIEELSTKEKYCVRIPYTNYHVYLDRNGIVWKNQDRAIMYLVNDEEYEIFNENEELIERVEAEELEKISKENKEEIESELKSI